jgi:hypothetical protein
LNGGAVYAEADSIIQAFTSTFEKNWAKEDGAGLFHKGSMLGDYTTFNGNQAVGGTLETYSRNLLHNSESICDEFLSHFWGTSVR